MSAKLPGHPSSNGWKARLGEIWRRRFRYRVTAIGLAYLAALTLMAAAAFVSANNLLFLLLAAMVAMLLLSGFMGRLNLAGLEVDVWLPPHSCAGRPVHAKLVVKNLKPWIPAFSLHLGFSTAPEGPLENVLYFPWIPGGGSAEQPVQLLFPRRGAFRDRRFQFFSRFPFGLAERRQEVTIRHEVIVYPRLDPQPGFAELLEQIQRSVAAQERGLGEDFYRIRPYEPSDSSRHVDWKATAHVGSLQVREFAQPHRQAVIIVLDLQVLPEAAAWFETAIECAAFLVFELVERRVPIRFLTQETDVTIASQADTYNILKYLALVLPTPGRLRAVPDDKTFQLVITQNPQWFQQQGWAFDPNGSCLLGPDAFGSAGVGARHHGRRHD